MAERLINELREAAATFDKRFAEDMAAVSAFSQAQIVNAVRNPSPTNPKADTQVSKIREAIGAAAEIAARNVDEAESRFGNRLLEMRGLLIARGADPGPLNLKGPPSLFGAHTHRLEEVSDQIQEALTRVGQATGYVAYLDLLGFSRRVSTGLGEHFFQKYQQALETALSSAEGVQYIVSSDSIVLYSTHDHEEGLNQLVRGVARVVWELLVNHIPVRGAISYGRFRETRTPRGTIVAGPPILDAIGFEQQQDWIGVLLTPVVIEKHPQIRLHGRIRGQAGRADALWTGRRIIQRCSVIPWQNKATGQADIYDGFVVVPTPNPEADAQTWGATIMQVGEALAAMERFAPDPRSQRKYRATSEFIASAQRLGTRDP